jgi:DNA integrity scanning protein DisA with diadenylate cyclase activity
METWIEHLNSPLVLIAFMLFVFAGVIKLLLKNNVIKVNQVNSAKLINKSLNYVFILALVGMIFGFFSQEKVLQAIPKTEPKITTPEKPPTQIKQMTKGDNSSAVIEKVDLSHKNVEQSTEGEGSSAIISGGDAAAVINKNK